MFSRRFLVALGVAVVSVVPATIGCSALATASEDSGRSAVGIARRADGSVVAVTAWCIGQRAENLQVASFDGQEATETIYAATGSSSEPVTVHTIGHIDGLTPTQNHGLPTSELLVAFNSGERRDWLQHKAYPSTAAVFEIDELPVTNEDLPTRVVAQDRQEMSLQELIGLKCVTPQPMPPR
ncbi:MAG: hypothetical protein Q4F67_04280 [Propionibacteriaceae bacterium]|nr:hypothetical protein [Propionibacteriaceae bacterium]